MEIDITTFFQNEDTNVFSNSIANTGLSDIATITWANSKDTDYSFVNEENKQEFINYFNEFGAWDDLEEWHIKEINALFIQQISGDINEFKELYNNWEEYDKSEQTNHNLFKGIDDKIYFALA